MAELARIGPGGRTPRPKPLLRIMIGNVLRRTRLGQGRTLADVARAARVSMPYLSEVERGRKEASSEVLAAVCDALRIELGDLVAGVERELAETRVVRTRVIRTDVAPLRPVSERPEPSGVRGAGDRTVLLAA